MAIVVHLFEILKYITSWTLFKNLNTWLHRV